MAVRKYKVGDKVKFVFIGEERTGVIIDYSDLDRYGNKRSRYTIEDGCYKYPVPFENIIQKIS